MTFAFSGSRSDARKYLSYISGRHYVYILCRPDGQPFYVGKGLNLRALEHEAEARRNHPFGESNPFKCNVIRKIIRNGGDIIYRIDSIYEIDHQFLCLEREAALILEHKRLHEGGYLTNLAGGVGNMSGAAPFSLKRHAATLSGEPEDNPERLVLNRFLLSIGPVESVPVKPAGQISKILPSTPHPQPREPTPRCAYALIASASAVGLQLSAGVQIPRSFTYQGVKGVLENGVSRDLLKAGMAKLIPETDPAEEKYELNSTQLSLLVSLLGREHLVERGLL
jgi:uncharacterized protein